MADTPEFDPLDQTQTRCLILGIDGAGCEHVYDRDRERVVVLDHNGIDHQRELAEGEKARWMAFVSEQRGWRKEQWVGYKLRRAVWGGK